MAEGRLSTHQQFDMIRCKLCNKLYDSPRLLHCLHSFCSGCLDKYIATTVAPSDNDVTCPLCQEVTTLPPTTGLDGLVKNTLIERYITQAQRDKTKYVAGREVLHMSQQALTEADLQSPDIVASIQNIANTAGHIMANDVADQSRIHNTETVKVRHVLQAKTTTLQENALDIVYCIDQVNQGFDDWVEQKIKLRDKIKQRSGEMQAAIAGIERRLISQLEDKDMETEMKNEAFSVKTKLHEKLRGSLTLVDFLKLLTEYGDVAELEEFSEYVKAQEDKVIGKNVLIMRNSHTFDPPQIDIQEGLEIMFGFLSEVSEETVAWDPKRPRIQQQNGSHDSSPCSDVESHFTNANPEDVRAEPHIHVNYMEINENGQFMETDNDQDFGNRYSKRFETVQAQKHRRRPMKSMSFDTGMSRSSFKAYMHPSVSEHTNVKPNNKTTNGHPGNETTTEYHILKETTDINKTAEETVTADDVKADETVSADETENNNMADNGNSNTDTNSASFEVIDHAIQTLAPTTSDAVLYPGQRSSWARRVSAPSSMIIDTLSRRRLSALSILERSNINTEGLNVSSDVESGLNDARLEWLRENVRRKADFDRQTSIDEGV